MTTTLTTPVGTFGTTPSAVAARLPGFTLLETPKPGQRGTTLESVVAWIDANDASVAVQLRDWTRLADADQEKVCKAAQAVIADFTAANVDVAEHPERAKHADSHDHVLTVRASAALEVLRGEVEAMVASIPTAPGSGGAGASWSFPPARIADDQPW